MNATAALLSLYSALHGADWSNNSRWLSEAPPCSWFGVTCAGSNITGIDLQGNELKGTVPTQVGQLLELTTLKMGRQHGSADSVSGTIPTQVGQLRAMQTLEIFALPSGSCFGGRSFDASGAVATAFTDHVESAWIDHCSDLCAPPLADNRSNLCANNPSIKACCPCTCAMCPSMPLSGSLPTQLARLSYLAKPVFVHSYLSGTLAPELGGLSSLVTLGFSNTRVSGTLPSQLGKLQGLWCAPSSLHRLLRKNINMPQGLGWLRSPPCAWCAARCPSDAPLPLPNPPATGMPGSTTRG